MLPNRDFVEVGASPAYDLFFKLRVQQVGFYCSFFVLFPLLSFVTDFQMLFMLLIMPDGAYYHRCLWMFPSKFVRTETQKVCISLLVPERSKVFQGTATQLSCNGLHNFEEF